MKTVTPAAPPATAEAPASALDPSGRPLAGWTLERFAVRIDEIAAGCGLSRRLIERERSSGRFPEPDLYVGRVPLWRPDTIRAWIAGGGGRP